MKLTGKIHQFKNIDWDGNLTISQMNAYWDGIKSLPELESYRTVLKYTHDSFINSFIEDGDRITLIANGSNDTCTGRQTYRLVFSGVSLFRTYKIDHKGKLTRRKVTPWIYAFDDIVKTETGFEYALTVWTKHNGWTIPKLIVIECEKIEGALL